ncbi:hypothetical protein Glove_117g211 [Diversispora epigaea]|uniref:BTB domain-containing protein n=1 Tax=Diversispora epigaea TaxID=1348612 RepID=A0A397J9P1_9GLOM|nr:hypothetical protein Glove_117g211 [Diversispora epigaea]
MTLNFYENLSNDYVKLLKNGNEHNIIIEVGEPPVMQTFKAHSTVLCYRCPYLYDEFKKSTINNDDNIKIIQRPQISVKVFDIIIKYIYGATVNLEKVETSIIFDLLVTANQFQLEELVARLQTFLIKNHTSWLKLNFSKIYHSSFQTDFTALQNYYNDIIVNHPNMIFESNDFNTLPEAALVSIVQRDDLQLEESKVWDYVIQWGAAQNKTLPSNLDDWSEKDFQILKNSIQQCLPHIRYFQFSNEHIMEKIYPYQQILEKKLMTDILKYSLIPNKSITSIILPPRNIFQITSSILTKEQVLEISTWIDKKEVTYKINNLPDDLQLEESKVWDYVIQWGAAQNKTLPSNLDDWSEKDFQILKNSIQQCLPHIRYFQFSNEHIMEKIYPYQQILEKKLMTDILKYSLIPNKSITSIILPPRNIFQITSSILTKEQVLEISTWIDKKEVTYKINNLPYKFELILRGSRDGFGNDVFWNLCNQKTNIVVVVKVKDTDEIVGGYNPKCWDSNFMGKFFETNDSFIFSLKNRNIKNHILSRVKNAREGICNNPKYGLNFNNDLIMVENQLFRIFEITGYEKPIRKTIGGFSIDDYEVFQISKRKNI